MRTSEAAPGPRSAGGASVRLLRTYRECQALDSGWNRILTQPASDIFSLGVTSRFEWSMLLWKHLLQETDQFIVVLENGDSLSGVFPLYLTSKTVHSIPCRVLAPIPMLYSGRDGFILEEARTDDLELVLDFLCRELDGWDVLAFSVVEGSPSGALVTELARRGRYHLRPIWEQNSPYILLQGSWDDFFSNLPRQFRTNLRSSERRLQGRGEARYREFVNGPELAYFMDSLLDIERESWKEGAGSSITAQPQQEKLYRSLIEMASEKGWFCGQLLELNGEPIAYTYGLLVDGVFYDLKSSFKLKHRDVSPGHVLTRLALERLLRRGVQIYDFRGACEEYKMRWTKLTYSSITYALYNRTVRGRLARASARLTSSVRR